jgi:glucosamine-phosphate N-acetyltransferase
MDISYRLLELSDYFKGYLNLLSELTNVGYVDYTSFEQQYHRINQNINNHKIIVIIKDDAIIGTGTILIEPKMIHNCRNVGHIEDVVIFKKYQGCGFGKKLINELINIAKSENCYKVILNCSDEMRPFYEHLGFTQKNAEMEHRFH